MTETPPDRSRPPRRGNPAWGAGGYAMTTALQRQGGSPSQRLGRLAGVLDRVRSATVMLDAEGVIREFRPDAEELLGWDRDDLVGKPFDAIFAEGHRGTAAGLLDTVLAGDDARGGFDALAADGSVVPVEVVMVGLRDADGHLVVLAFATSSVDLNQVRYDAAVLDSLFEQFPVGIVVLDADGRYVRLNREQERINGLSPEDLLGHRISEMLPGLDRRLMEIPDEVLRDGIPVIDAQYGGTTPGSDGERVWSVSYSRLEGPDGAVLGLSGLVIDVTDRHRAALEARATRERLSLVNRAGSRMGTALDVERTAVELAEVVVPDFADAILVEIKEQVFDERIGPVGPAWPAPVRRRRLLAYSRPGPGAGSGSGAASGSDSGSDGDSDSGFGGAVPELVRAQDAGPLAQEPEFHAEQLAGRARLWRGPVPAEPLLGQDGSVLMEPPQQPFIVAPMLAREALLGSAYYFRYADRAPFEPEDVEVAEELTTRAAVSIDNGRLYFRERSTALMLQRALLPQRIPETPGVEVAYRYLPGSVGSEVGGDWFDVIQLSGSRVALVVGDVMGIGVRAAGIMGQFRTAARTLAALDLSPAQVLHQLDELGASLSENHLATCIYAVYDPATGKLAMSRAGHPPPLLLTPDGSVGGLDVPPSPPLGVGGGAYRSWVFETKEFDIPDRSRIAFYTDGMVEDKGRDIDEGIGQLAALLSNCPPDSLEECCDAVIEVLGVTGDKLDDATLLLAQVESVPAANKAHWQLAAHPSAVADARRLVRHKLRDWGMDQFTDTAVLLVSELVTNAQRYGHSPVELDLMRTDRLLVEVGDALDVVPQVRRARDMDEGGRGLQLVNQLAGRWGTRSTGHGKIVWFELVPA